MANSLITRPADTTPPPEEKDTGEDLYEERIDRFISDDVSTTPLAPIDESNGDNGKETTEERIEAALNAFEAVFPEKAEEESEKKGDDEGTIYEIHISSLRPNIDMGSREKVAAVIYISVLNQTMHSLHMPANSNQANRPYTVSNIPILPHIASISFPSLPSLSALPHVPKSLTIPLPILTIVPQLSTTGQITRMTILQRTHMKLITHQPVKPAPLKIHSFPNRVKDTSRIATTKKAMLNETARRVARRALAGSMGSMCDILRKSTTLFPMRTSESGRGDDCGSAGGQ